MFLLETDYRSFDIFHSSVEEISVLLFQIDHGIGVKKQRGNKNPYQGKTNGHMEHVSVHNLSCISF